MIEKHLIWEFYMKSIGDDFWENWETGSYSCLPLTRSTESASKSDIDHYKPLIKMLNKDYNGNIRSYEGLFEKSLSFNFHEISSSKVKASDVTFIGLYDKHNLGTLLFDGNATINLKANSDWTEFDIGMSIHFDSKFEQFKKLKRIFAYYKKMKMKENNSKYGTVIHEITFDFLNINLSESITLSPLYKTKKTFFGERLVRDKESYSIKFSNSKSKLNIIFKGTDIVDAEIECDSFKKFIDEYSIDLNGDDAYYKYVISLFEMVEI